MGGGSGLSRSSEAGVSREDWPGEEGAGGKRRAAPGADESVAAAFRLRLASAAWAWVTCAQPPACPPGCASGARRIGARSLLSVPKLAFSYFLTSTLLRPCPAPCFPSPEALSLLATPCRSPPLRGCHSTLAVPRVHLLTLTQAFVPA